MATLNDPSIFKPQYNMSVRNTFVSFTLAMIRDENSLNVLMSTGEPLRDKSLPSWCPDWTCNRNVTLIGYYDYIYYAVNGNFCPEFNNLQMTARDELVLDGALIDVAREVYDLEALEKELKACIKDKDSYSFTPVLKKFAHEFGLHKRRLRHEISPEGALLRTLSADHWFFGAHVQSSYKELWFPTHLRFWDLKRNKKHGLARYLDDFTNITTLESTDSRHSQPDFFCRKDQNYDSRHHTKESPYTHSVIDKVYRQTSPYYIEGQDFDDARHVDMHTLMAISKEAISQALFFFKGKKIIITQRGYVALGTAETRVGDSLCSLWGADVPFVMREKSRASNRSWHIICECYIDGLMYGEIVRDPTKDTRYQKCVPATPSLVDWVKARRFVVS
ncbi:hypothetical protein K3495_g2114 [Podosphaera aphanis]|nr:hypothetical protein K3495_g2114 [Podosphaera aphanis]